MFMNWGITYYTIGAFIQTFITLIIVVNFFSKKKQKNTSKILGFFFLLFLPTPLSFFIATIFQLQITAYYRWFTVPSVFFSYSILIYFFLIFKEKVDNKKIKIIKNIILFILFLFSSIITIFFYLKTYNAKIIYSFSGHNYELFDLETNKIIFNFLLVILAIMSISLIFRTIRLLYFRKKKYISEIFLSILLIWVLFITQLIPTITNILSVYGIIERGFHYLIFVITIVLGFFISFILYNDIEKEEVSLQYRLSGIGIVTTLLITQIIAYISLKDIEKNFIFFYQSKLENVQNIKEYNDFEKINFIKLVYNHQKDEIFYKDKTLKEEEIDFIKQKQNLKFIEIGKILLIRIDKNDLYFYIDYSILRKYIHTNSKNLFYFIVIYTILISLIYPFFIKKEIILPIEELTNKISFIEREQDYNVEVKKYFNDEIGFITDTFNTMINDLKKSYDDLLNYSHELEKKVEIRSNELKEQIERINQIKQQQEGDYYLLSLLMKPLIKNYIKSYQFNIDGFIKQKKIYNFRNKTGEIGGDNIILERLILYNTNKKQINPYIFFSISDALGVSLQGAYGSIIYSLLIYSIINSVQKNPILQNTTQLLQECYYLLIKIFSFFEGELTCSGIIGILDEFTGEILYINFDFPHPFIIRSNKDNVIVEAKDITDYQLPSLGVNSIENIKIQKIKLNTNDKIIFYSDGLIINEKEKNTINIKTILEEFDFNIIYLFQFLKKLNNISDDISILSIENISPINNTNILISKNYEDLITYTLYSIKKKQSEKISHLIISLEKNGIIDAELFFSFVIFYYFQKKYHLSLLYIEYALIKNNLISNLSKKNIIILANIYKKVVEKILQNKYLRQKNNSINLKMFKKFINDNIQILHKQKIKQYKVLLKKIDNKIYQNF
jgi:hypothetical protein